MKNEKQFCGFCNKFHSPSCIGHDLVLATDLACNAYEPNTPDPSCLPRRDMLDYSCDDCSQAGSCPKKTAVTCPDFQLRKDSPYRIIENREQENDNGKNIAAMRKTIPIFASEHLWSRAEQQLDSLGEKKGTNVLWSLLRVKEDRRAPPMLVIDTDSYIRPSTSDVCLVCVDQTELAEKLSQVPNDILERIKRIAADWGSPVSEKIDVATAINRIHVAYKPVPRLKDVSILERINWADFLENELVAHHATKDPSLMTIHKAHLLRVPSARYRPNGLEFSNSGTGKSEFYERIGHRYDKVTNRSLLGFAKSPIEIYPGVIADDIVPIACDQIESQSAQQIFSYLFSAMQQGHGIVSSGAVRFRVNCDSTFAILGNPIGYGVDPAKSFTNLIEHASMNTALGSRFALILYGTNFARVEPKDSQIASWTESVQFFRAVEEYAWPKLKKIWTAEETFVWLHKKIPQYEESVYSSIEKLDPTRQQFETVRGFLIEHAKGAQPRIKGAALNIALLEALPQIALATQNDVSTLLERADEHLDKLVEINIQSIVGIAREYEHETEIHARSFCANLPNYLQEIVFAIELWRRSNPQEATIQLKAIPYEPESGYFSKAIDKLQNRKQTEQLFLKLQRLLGIQLKKVNGDFEATLSDRQARTYIEPKGSLVTLFPVSPISQFPDSQRHDKEGKNEANGTENELIAKARSVSETGEIGKFGKSGNYPQKQVNLFPNRENSGKTVEGTRPVLEAENPAKLAKAESPVSCPLEVHEELVKRLERRFDVDSKLDREGFAADCREVGQDPDRILKRFSEIGLVFDPGDGTIRRGRT